ncbi:MAG TPA: hypothetical protein VFS40_03320 [Gemmatimonadales bacterium]|nr:hypothetical protein [Gemmatimonadales bacterium]
MRAGRVGLAAFACLLVAAARPGAVRAQRADSLPSATGPAAVAAAAALTAAAERVRAAWERHDAAAAVASSGRVLVQLPGAEPAAPLGQAQAAALLGDYLAPASEVGLQLAAAREVSPDRGYVELSRRFRVAGTQEVRSQSLLLGYRRDGAGEWRLAELRVVE